MTSIEWLIEQLHAPCRGIPSHIIEQAKEMHKHEIIKSYEFGQNDGWNTRENDYNKNYHKKGTGESYYNYEFNYKYGEL